MTSLAKSSVSFSGRALWILSTSAFLLGVPWALAYAEEEQYIQLEREQGMIKGANEVCNLLFLFCIAGDLLWDCLFLLLFPTPILSDDGDCENSFVASKSPRSKKMALSFVFAWIRI